jgi:arylsulfatase A-like enzyme
MVLFKKIIIAFFLLATFTAEAQQTGRPKQPNIIFIFADDLGYGDIGCYGQQKIETPNIDKLARNGLKFTQFYSGSSVCAPARSSFFTGQHTGHTAIRGNKQFPPEGQTPLSDSVGTLANILQQNGYATAAFGKWGLGFNQNSGDPNKKGFDHFFGYNCQSLAHDYYPPYLWDDHNKVDLAVNEEKDSIYSAALIQQQAINYIKQKNTKPYFLYLAYTLPHGDVIGPDDDLYKHYATKFKEQPLTGKELQTRAHNKKPEPLPHAQFAAMVSRLDNYVGQIVKALTQTGQLQNTLIIFTSDNGPHRENGGDPDFFNSNGPYRGIKRDLYEGGIRVPFIASWPGKIKTGLTPQVAALWDMYPTFLELAGIRRSQRIDGISIVPTLLKTKPQSQHSFLYWEFHENDGRQAVRWKNWKLVRLNVNTANKTKQELYNLGIDPSETTDLATKNPLIVSKMEGMMKNAHVYNPDWPLLPAEFK